MAFALADGGNGGIVGVDDLAVAQRLALCEPAGLRCDPVMGFKGGCQLGVQTCPLILRQLRRAVPARLGGPRQRQDLLSHLQPWRLGLAQQCHQHLPHPPALATEAAHHLLEGMLELLCSPRPRRRLVAHSAVMAVMTWRTFWGLRQGGGIIDPLAALLTGTGVDHQVCRAHQPVRHRHCGLDGQPFRHQGRIQTAANVGEHLRKHNMRLGAIDLDRSDPTGRHHREVGP